MTTQPNWYPDPQNPYQLRWWDGTQWTAHTTPKPVPQTVAPAGYVPLSKQPTSKVPFVVVGIVLALIVAVIVAVIYGVMSVFGVSTRFSDEETLELQKELSSKSSNIDITVYADGAVCEQLCQELYVNLALPDDPDSYNSRDIADVVGNTYSALRERGKMKDTYFCFDFKSEDFNTNDNSATPEEQALYDRLDKLGFPKADYDKTDEETDLRWMSYTCLKLSPTEMNKISQS